MGNMMITAEVIWLWDCRFFYELSDGRFAIFRDADYKGGDNSIEFTDMTYQEYLDSIGMEFGRGKGMLDVSSIDTWKVYDG